MLADWLQGTNMYTLYSSYGVDVGTLFLTGFLSSAVFGTFLGVLTDRWGRKMGCVIFCVLEIVINALEHVPSMPALLLGRVLGGLSTSLLFSAFESWMVTEHRRRGFPEELLASTFGICSWGNGVVAIAAGLLAQLAADVSGDIGPFQLAILLTAVSLVMILGWRENYGRSDDAQDSEESSLSSTLASIHASSAMIRAHPSILFLGLSQACFEGAVYTFVFMWVPSLLLLSPTSPLPTGLVFSAFMLAMTLGGSLFSTLLPLFPGGPETLCIAVYIVSAIAMAIPVLSFEFWPVLLSFLVLEAMVGMFNSCGATLRSKYFPDAMQSSIMTVFRLPLNVLVVIGTKLTDKANDVPSLQFVFITLIAMHALATLLQIGLMLSKDAHSLIVDKEARDKKKQ